MTNLAPAEAAQRQNTTTSGRTIMDKQGWISRREVAQLLGVGGAAIAAGLPSRVMAQATKTALVIGIDISDTITLDPARQASYSPPMTLQAAYEALVTMEPGDYINLKPMLATKWERTPDGKGWRFTIRENVKFASGNPMSAEDVKWSLDRVLNIKDQPAQYVANIDRVVLDRKLLEQHGGDASKDAKEKDKATAWLNENSAGAGAYRLARWERNQQIQLVRNEHYWRGKPAFERVVIRHMGDSAAQLLAIRRGDIDIAFNLIPEQVATLKGDANVRLEQLASLDFVYMALTENPEFNKALAVKEARQAIGYSIDYDGIKNSLIGGAALRPAHFLPIGINGSTEEIARQVGFREDLGKAKELLAKAGLADGFEFEINYANAAIAGVSYQLLAQKIQADVGRVGIKARLAPVDQVNLRTQFTTGKSPGGVLTFWNPPAIKNALWALATVERVARRVHWTPPEDLVKLVHQAAGESGQKKQAELWVEYQKRMVDQANHFILFQPTYQVAARNSLAKVPVTAAGWLMDMSGVTSKA